MIRLRGSGGNTAGIGAKVYVTCSGMTQMLEVMPTRGFQSSVDPRLHFGLGQETAIDSLVVVWPDQRHQVLTHVAANQMLTLDQNDAKGTFQFTAPASEPLLLDLTAQSGVSLKHEEDAFLDWNREPLMTHLLSTEGPALAVGDINGDSLDDLFLGGAKWQSAHVLLQLPNGQFRDSPQRAISADSLHEDVDAAFFDADGDKDVDLYVVSGGNEFWGEAAALQDRLYLNDGKGVFTRAPNALPAFFKNGSCVVPGDFDGDGDIDLFVGSRVVAREYGRIPRSQLLQNDGNGQFRDVTSELAPALAEAGMVSAATWMDYDNDKRLDLIVVGEWMPVRVFKQTGGGGGDGGAFVDRTAEAGLAGSEGWWNSVHTADLNADGRPDLVLGNLGLNSYVRASADQPLQLYIADFFATGSLKQILTFYKDGISYPLAGRDELVKLMPPLRSRYTSYAKFGASRITDIFNGEELRKAHVRQAHVLASSIAVNSGGAFRLQPLPMEAQFAPVYATLSGDFDANGTADLLLGGNLLGAVPMLGRYDAGYGLLLRGNANGFTSASLAEMGLTIDAEVRDMKVLRAADGRRRVVVARNNASLMLLRVGR
jgi:hypothetical protein